MDNISKKIYHNECASNPKYLVHWNKGENFPSLGIGHFIWYPKGVEERFDESFPLLMAYMLHHDREVPKWLLGDAPWQDSEAMYHDKRLEALRSFLLETMDLQAAFMAQRVETIIPKDAHLKRQFNRVAKSPDGYYLLIDYLNFKGSGLNPNERYAGQGWGLMQVLGCMRAKGDAKQAFAMCAKTVLQERVKNSPPQRREKRWLKGWFNRIDTYIK
jgi:hypothetical protein